LTHTMDGTTARRGAPSRSNAPPGGPPETREPSDIMELAARVPPRPRFLRGRRRVSGATSRLRIERGTSLGHASPNGVTVLFTSAGRRVELLRSFRRANESLGSGGRIVAVDVDPLAPAMRVAHRAYIVPRLDAPDYIPTLAEICRRERVDIVFPLIDPDVPVLAGARATLEATGARLAVVPSTAVPIAADKWQTNRFFQKLGLTTPRSWLPEDLDPAAVEYPV